MLLYLLRHGQSLANIDLSEHYRTSNVDIPLSVQGKKQAEELADRLKNTIDPKEPIIIWTSPYRRALQTAFEIQKRFPRCTFREGTFRQDILLREHQFGGATGELSIESWVLGKEEQEQLMLSVGRDYLKLPQGESFADVCLRAEVFLRKVLPMDAIHIIVSHCGFCQALHCQIEGEYDKKIIWDNCQARIYRKAVSIVYRNGYLRHQGELT